MSVSELADAAQASSTEAAVSEYTIRAGYPMLRCIS